MSYNQKYQSNRFLFDLCGVPIFFFDGSASSKPRWENGPVAVRRFVQDIKTNLICWAADKKHIFYETQNFWYVAGVAEAQNEVVVTRINKETGSRRDGSVDKASGVETLGKAWLSKDEQKEKKTLIWRF